MLLRCMYASCFCKVTCPSSHLLMQISRGNTQKRPLTHRWMVALLLEFRIILIYFLTLFNFLFAFFLRVSFNGFILRGKKKLQRSYFSNIPVNYLRVTKELGTLARQDVKKKYTVLEQRAQSMRSH